MGCGILVKCRDCEANPSEEVEPYIGDMYQLGVGMIDSSLERVIGYLHYTKRSYVLDIIHNHQVEDSDYCNELFHCSKWRTPLEIISENDIPNIPCVVCGHKTLYIDEDSLIMWD